jgi:hypothetical protein
MTLTVDSGFQTISTAEQVTPFAGGIVAYKTDSNYFGAKSPNIILIKAGKF